MAEQFNEPEEMSSNFDPMGIPVKEREYTKPNVTIDPSEMNKDIPEPSFQPPPLNLDEPKIDAPPKREPPKPVNDELTDLPRKDKKVAAGHVARMIISGYELLCNQAEKGMKFNERKLTKMAQQGEIDFSIQIPYDYTTNQTMSAGDFIKEYNEQQDGSLKVSQEWKDETTPVLERVLEKRGIGATDEQMLIYLFGQDILLKGSSFIAAKQTMKEVLGMMREMTEAMKSGYKPQQSQGYTPAPTPPPAPASDGAMVIDTGFDSFEEEQETEENVDNSPASVAETVEAQLRNQTVAEMRREEALRARANKPPLKKRGRKPKK